MMSVFSCRENSFRVSLGVDGRLTLAGRVALLLHQLMCSGCRSYAKQIRSLTTLLRRRSAQVESPFDRPTTLSHEARERIVAALRSHPG